jgi:ornithine cyclodeaminase/alanine dehydrogenase-like protein (mu-crystallin family)
MLLIREDEVRLLLPMPEAIRLVREAFAALAGGTAQNQPRRRLQVPGGAVLHQLAGSAGGYFGTKTYSTHPKHGAWFLVQLFESSTGRPVAIIEANHLGQIRTGAASGVATERLARPESSRLGVIGSGFQARAQVDAIRCVRNIGEMRVWSRNPAGRETFARELGCVAAGSAEEAVRDADIVVTATSARDPVVESAWVREGAHINAIGSNNPQRRELPADLIARADVIAVDAKDQAKVESGDLLLAWAEADWSSPRLCELQQVVSGIRGRSSPAELTIFKSNGLGVEDVAVAGYVYERAVAEKVGMPLDLYS